MPISLSPQASQSKTGPKTIEGPAVRSTKVAALSAIALFLSLSAGLTFFASRGNSEKPDGKQDCWSGTGSVEILVSDFNRLTQRPNIVLLGSSLMMYPIWASDFSINGKIADIFHYRDSILLRQALNQLGLKDESVFSLASFGEMSSDSYIYVDEFLKGDRKPDWLVLGVAPRDFSDADLPTPTASPTFKKLVGLKNFPRYESAYLPSLQDKLDFVLSQTNYFYSKRWRLQREMEKAAKKVYRAVSKDNSRELEAELDSKKDTDEKALFLLAGTPEKRFNTSLREYRRRYRNIGEHDLGLQMDFLTRTLSTCRERGINVLVVNMPLSKANRDLLPQGFYDGFRSRLSALVKGPAVHFMDLGDNADFKAPEDYWDSTHLNHSGGKKLIAMIAPIIAGTH